MSYLFKEEDSHPKHKESRDVENVLVLQGGGSLGALACGVFKALVKKDVRIDIVAGTSIGAVNAAIIVGSKSDHPEEELENFWLEIAESSPNIIPDIFVFDYDNKAKKYVSKKISAASANAAMFGVPKMFTPIWWRWSPWSHDEDENDKISNRNKREQSEHYYDFLNPRNWTYYYDHTPLAKTLDKYIDYKKLNLAAIKEELPEVRRLIITAVDVMTAKPLIFDNAKMEIKAKHILASSGYPIYGFPWIELEDNVYAWDGSLLSNTPVREVLYSSPRNDKNIFIVENYPRKIQRLPSNMAEVESRAKDIIFSDKNMDNIKMSRLITRHIQLIESLYDIVQNKVDPAEIDRHKLEKIKSEYNTLINNYGAQIKSVTRIVRSELESPSMLQNADFSPKTIRELISQGEAKTMEKLSYCKSVNYDFNVKK
ncbi:MAG TPA: patatin-like phospholipase family protein [Nitrososphaeraceae archaeon]|jgi:NTE family protein|nr:patatin-like phospholipase family protein [Nitrososphaeraceae archaeon]